MTPVLSVSTLSKSFNGVRVLKDVSLTLEPGEIRALVGQNGCGKSTLIKILAGFYSPDRGGSVTVDGRSLQFSNGVASEQAGLRFVHQDLGLVDALDTVDNLALGKGYPSFRGRISWRTERRRAREALAELGYSVDVTKPVADLAMSECTAVAVARALSPVGPAPKVLILDEPTANLPNAEAERLYALAKRVASTGVAVLFVSHHFDEVFELADTVTVIRDGVHVATGAVKGMTEDALIAQVIGRTLAPFERDVVEVERGPVALHATSITGATLRGVDITVHAGEVVGVAGITGSGRDEVAPALFGGMHRRGVVEVDGAVLPPGRPDRSIAMGIGLVPAERRSNAAFMQDSIRENVTVSKAGEHMVGGILRRRRERADVARWLERLDVRPRNTEYAMSALSGGNQQKVVLARWLRMDPKLLILDEPTQGVDVGAKADIHSRIDEAASRGTGVLVVSTDHEELVRLCHRVLILRRGRVVDELTGTSLDNDLITAATIGRDPADVA
jgi:ribose transport system ATP-binding protein